MGTRTAGAAAPPSPAAQGGRLVYAQSVPINQVDPGRFALVYPAAQELSFVVLDRLINWDQKLQLQPALAESWSLSSDQLTWTFKLRKGVEFQDGTPFNAAAVEAHVKYITDPQNPAPSRTLWKPFTKEFRVVDDYTVQFVSEKPYGPTLRYLALEGVGVASPAARAKYGENFPRHPVGTGPYAVSEFEAGRSVKVNRFDKYRGGRPALDGIEFRVVPEAQTRLQMLQSGEADLIADVSPVDAQQVSQGANTTLLRTPGARPFWIEFNLNLPVFKDPRVRQALNFAVDKDAIVKNLFRGYASVIDSPVASTIPGYQAVGSYPYDPGKAKRLLAEAGWTPGQGGVLQKNGSPLKFTLLTADGIFPQDVLVAEAVQSNLKAAGCDVSIWKVDASSFWGYLRLPPDQAKYETVLFGFNPSNGDVGFHMNALFRSNSDPTKAPDVWNLMWYSNSEVDALLNQADQTVDEKQRFALLGKAQKIVWDDAPMIWLYAPDILAGARKSVGGVFLWPTVFMSLAGAFKSA